MQRGVHFALRHHLMIPAEQRFVPYDRPERRWRGDRTLPEGLEVEIRFLGIFDTVAAIGKPEFVTADMVKPGAAVIDVGMNRDDAGKLCGDVDFAGVKEVAGWITPVPGGVGPMTRAMLLVNTIEAAEQAHA